MKFNDQTNYQGLVQDSNFLAGLSITDTSTYTLKDKTRNGNAWYRKINSWIWEAAGDWEYDDTNWTNLPIATTDLVNNQQDYELPSVAQRVDRAEVLDSNGDYVIVRQIDKSQISSQAMSEFYETAGLPMYYDLVGRSLLLYPKPSSSNVTTTNGLKVYFGRDIDEFSVTDTATEPGFSRNYHRLVSLGMAYDYCIREGLDDKKRQIRDEIEQLRGQLQSEYASRHRAFKTRIIPRIQKEI